MAAVPFALVMVGIAWALVKDLRRDPMMVRKRYADQVVDNAVVAGVTQHGDDFALTVEAADQPVMPTGDSQPSK